ncbi:hypothetical protein BaRGS_00011088 [Batillaria attramentaria]|uniref:Major facilitator superfamily (MFS) profile domain-containing protein n=1 Tax=Batillaria attramentaria TaxID=370345 RepID=A0ABD0LE38_9CAEN
MKFDEIVSVLGEFGPYQKRIYFLICLPSITVYIQMVINIFTMAVPAHRCAVPGLDNDTYAIQDSHHAAIVNTSISPHDSCHVIIDVVNGTVLKNSTLAEGPFRSAFSPSGVSNSEMVRGSGENVSLMEGHLAENSEAKTQEATCSRYVYDTSVFSKTIVTQMNLVCEQKTKVTHAKMALFAGATFAAVGCVPPSDVFGRKRMLMVSFFFHAVASLAITWSTYYIPLCVFMFLNGMASVGVFAHSFVIGMELVGPSKRVWAGFVIEVCFALGLVLLAPMAYLLRDWQHLQIASAIVPFGYLSYYWLIPESPRWLLSKGRVLEAEAIIRTAAKVNKVTLPARVLDEQSLRVETQEFAVTLGYYGLALNIGSLSGNIFLNVFISSGVLELVSYLLCPVSAGQTGSPMAQLGPHAAGWARCTLTILHGAIRPQV